MEILLPHLDYTLIVKPRSTYNSQVDGIWLCERRDEDTSILYIELPKKAHEYGMLAHELIYVIQNICRDRGMSITTESENIGYMIQYFMNVITCGDYELTI